MDWGKLFGFFVGIPIALVLAAVTVMGIKNYEDFNTKIQQASLKIDSTHARLDKLEGDSDQLSSEYQKLTTSLASIKNISAKSEEVSAEYQKVLGRLNELQTLSERVNILDAKVINVENAVKSALVIGNSNYTNIPILRNPASDAESVGRALKEIGFNNVRTLVNSDFKRMTEETDSLISKAIAGDTIFIYYAGHGVQINGVNYLIPTDVPALSADGVELIRSHALNMNNLVSKIKASKLRIAVIVLDACRDNPFTKVSVTRGLASARLATQSYGDPAIFMFYSASDGGVALDGDGRNSVFAESLVKELKKPGIALTELAHKVRLDVAEITNNKQLPAVYDETVSPVFLTRHP